MFATTIIFLFICVYLVYVWMCRRYYPLNHLVPVHSGRVPIFGHALGFMNFAAQYETITQYGIFSYENGGVSVFFLGAMPYYVVADPEDVSTILHKCLEKMFVYKLVEPLLGKMLVAAEVPVWKRSRRMIDLGFKQNILEEYLDIFQTEANRLVQVFGENVGKGAVDVTDEITRSFLETTCRTTLGELDDQYLVNNKYVVAVNTLLEVITVRFMRPWYILEPIFKMSSYHKKFKEALEVFFGVTKKMIQLRKEQHLRRLKNKQNFDNQGNRFRSFLDVLLENSVTETGSTFTDDEMRNLVDNVLLAAFDTTISEMVLVLVCLGSYPEVQDKIYEEIMDVLGNDEHVTKESLSKLVYLEAAIKESIRLYPIGPIIGRRASSDVELRNLTLPAGSNILIHLWGVNVNPKYWGADAKEFKPERWFSDSLPKNAAAFASFSPGRRGCPGKMYTLMYFKATLVPIIRRYKLTADRSNLKLAFAVMTKPKSGHYISIQDR